MIGPGALCSLTKPNSHPSAPTKVTPWGVGGSHQLAESEQHLASLIWSHSRAKCSFMMLMAFMIPPDYISERPAASLASKDGTPPRSRSP